MTLGEAAGALIAAQIDQTPLDPAVRRDVLRAIPAECRFVSDTHDIAVLATIQAILDYVDDHSDTRTGVPRDIGN